MQRTENSALAMRYTALDVSAIEGALAECLADTRHGGVIALLPEAEKEKLPLLQAYCRQNGLALGGGIFPALLHEGHFVNTGAWLLPFRQMPPHFLLPVLNGGDQGAAATLVEAVLGGLSALSSTEEKPLLFLVFDSMVPNIASILDEVYYALSNRVAYAGVNAGSETFQAMPCLFDEHHLVGDGVLGLLLPGVAGSFQLEHGFELPSHAMIATSSHGNCIAMIDWQPAFDVYRQIVWRQYGVSLTVENFYQHAVHFPIGIQRASGDVVVRIPVALTEDGALFCVGEIPEHAMLVVLRAPAAGAAGCIDKLAAKLSVGRPMPLGQLLTFYCAGRRLHLGDDAEKELGALQAASGAAEMGGALSLGEVGSVIPFGYPMFHNAALVCASWGEK